MNLPPVIRWMRSFPRPSLQPSRSSTQSSHGGPWNRLARSIPVLDPPISIPLKAATREVSYHLSARKATSAGKGGISLHPKSIRTFPVAGVRGNLPISQTDVLYRVWIYVAHRLYPETYTTCNAGRRFPLQARRVERHPFPDTCPTPGGPKMYNSAMSM